MRLALPEKPEKPEKPQRSKRPRKPAGKGRQEASHAICESRFEAPIKGVGLCQVAWRTLFSYQPYWVRFWHSNEPCLGCRPLGGHNDATEHPLQGHPICASFARALVEGFGSPRNDAA